VCTRRSDEESGGGEIDWDKLGFGLTPTDYMYVTRCSPEDRGDFPRGELCRYGNIELSPSSGVLNYAQVRFGSVRFVQDRQTCGAHDFSLLNFSVLTTTTTHPCFLDADVIN
jgi:hypothetical protein